MTPENLVAIEEMVSQVETLLNSFADATTRIRDRMIDTGWEKETAEAFAVATVGTMASGFMTQLSAPNPQTLESVQSPVLGLAIVACSAALVMTTIFLLVWWIA